MSKGIHSIRSPSWEILAFRTEENNAKNPDWWKGPGPDGFRAPETISFVDRDTQQPVDEFSVLSRANIYGLGLILFCLVKLEPRPRQPNWLGDPANNDLYQITPVEKNILGYNEEVYHMIEQCLRFRPYDRFAPCDLLSWIRYLIRDDRDETDREDEDPQH